MPLSHYMAHMESWKPCHAKAGVTIMTVMLKFSELFGNTHPFFGQEHRLVERCWIIRVECVGPE